MSGVDIQYCLDELELVYAAFASFHEIYTNINMSFEVRSTRKENIRNVVYHLFKFILLQFLGSCVRIST